MIIKENTINMVWAWRKDTVDILIVTQNDILEKGKRKDLIIKDLCER